MKKMLAKSCFRMNKKNRPSSATVKCSDLDGRKASREICLHTFKGGGELNWIVCGFVYVSQTMDCRFKGWIFPWNAFKCPTCIQFSRQITRIELFWERTVIRLNSQETNYCAIMWILVQWKWKKLFKPGYGPDSVELALHTKLLFILDLFFSLNPSVPLFHFLFFCFLFVFHVSRFALYALYHMWSLTGFHTCVCVCVHGHVWKMISVTST